MRGLQNCGKIQKATAEQRMELVGYIEAEAHRTGRPFDVSHYNYCLKIACQQDQLGVLQHYVQRMKEHEVAADVTTYNMLLHSYGRRGNLEQSV
jgi:hypothetical protein